MILLDITIPGDPRSKGRPRTGKGRTYTPKGTRDAEDLIRSIVDPLSPTDPYDGPVKLTLTFYCATRRRTDSDNLEKLVRDAIQRGKRKTGGVIMDDCQILVWAGRMYRRAEGEEPRTVILLETLDEEESTKLPGHVEPGELRSAQDAA